MEVWSPPNIDLTNDLDEVAALASALDLIAGPANATLNIAAACGTPTWFVCPPGGWPMLGTDRYPWYSKARVFMPPGFNRWKPAMAAMARSPAPGRLGDGLTRPTSRGLMSPQNARRLSRK